MIIYTKDQIEQIEKAIFALWSYANQHKKKPLSRCYQFCETILKNIKICRDDNWQEIGELSKYIKEDWDEAEKLHMGQYNAYFYLHEYDFDGKINDKIDELKKECSICIYKTHKTRDDIVPVHYKNKQYTIPGSVTPETLNEVYRQFLEWGEKRRRPIQSIVDGIAADANRAEKQMIADYVEVARNDIEEYIYFRYQEFGEEIDYNSLYEWIQTKYRWIDHENLTHAVSQGIYYAMK